MTLVERRDADAFAVLYDRHGGAAYSLAHRIVGDPSVAEDVTQEAFISVWRSGARFDAARGSVRSWTLGIVRNRAIDALRRSSGSAPKLDLDDDAVLESQTAGELTDSEAIRRETSRRVRGALRELPAEQGGGDRARLLRRLHPCRDRLDAGDAARYGQGTDAAGAWRRSASRSPRAWGSKVPRRCCHEPTADCDGRCATTSPPTRSARSTSARRRALEHHLEGCERCRGAAALAARRRSTCCPAAVEQRTPPPALRENLMATVRAEAAPSTVGRAARGAPRVALLVGGPARR